MKVEIEWISVSVSLPPEGEPVLTNHCNTLRILCREWDSGDWETSQSPFWYWDDPADLGSFECFPGEITHWALFPALPPYVEVDYTEEPPITDFTIFTDPT